MVLRLQGQGARHLLGRQRSLRGRIGSPIAQSVAAAFKLQGQNQGSAAFAWRASDTPQGALVRRVSIATGHFAPRCASLLHVSARQRRRGAIQVRCASAVAVVSQVAAHRSIRMAAQSRLTHRSSGAPTASHLARVALWFILHHAGQAASPLVARLAQTLGSTAPPPLSWIPNAHQLLAICFVSVACLDWVCEHQISKRSSTHDNALTPSVNGTLAHGERAKVPRRFIEAHEGDAVPQCQRRRAARRWQPTSKPSMSLGRRP